MGAVLDDTLPLFPDADRWSVGWELDQRVGAVEPRSLAVPPAVAAGADAPADQLAAGQRDLFPQAEAGGAPLTDRAARGPRPVQTELFAAAPGAGARAARRAWFGDQLSLLSD